MHKIAEKIKNKIPIFFLNNQIFKNIQWIEIGNALTCKLVKTSLCFEPTVKQVVFSSRN